MKLIVGLGNPGREYSQNRHNVGFLCVNRLARKHGLDFNRTQKRSRVALGKINREEVVLAKPHTFMNLSGEAVSALLRQFSLSVDSLIVIHDDLDLPVGKIRIRQGGSSGGHKGVASIITSAGSNEFIRLRVGIGHPRDDAEENTEIVDYVLGNFTTVERKLMDEAIDNVVAAIGCIIEDNVTAAMNKYN